MKNLDKTLFEEKNLTDVFKKFLDSMTHGDTFFDNVSLQPFLCICILQILLPNLIESLMYTFFFLNHLKMSLEVFHHHYLFLTRSKMILENLLCHRG